MKIYDRMLKINKLVPFCHSFRGGRFSFLAFTWICAVLVIAVTGCRDESSAQGNLQSKAPVVACSESVQFEPVVSDYFSIGKLCGVDVAVVRSVVGKDTLVHKYVMMDSLEWSCNIAGSRKNGIRRWYCVCRLTV